MPKAHLTKLLLTLSLTLILAGLLLIPPILAQGPNAHNVEFVGHIGGVTYAVFVQGNYV